MLSDISLDLQDLGYLKEYKVLYDMSYKINLQNIDFIRPFLEVLDRDDDLSHYYRYLMSPEWGEASGNYRFRFIIIKCDSDFVFVPLKVVDAPSRPRYFYVSGDIISLDETVVIYDIGRL